MSNLGRLLGFSGCLVTMALGAPRAARSEGPARGPAVATAPYFVKTASSLAELEKTLQGKGAHNGELLKPGATALEIIWRHEEDHEQKELEVHDGKDHVFFVTEGQATFTLGGQLLGPHELSPGEWRAPQSQHSQTVDAAKGDLIFIPHGTVHGRSAKGRRFTMLQLSFWPGGASAAQPAAAVAPGAAVPGPAAASGTRPPGSSAAPAAASGRTDQRPVTPR